MQRPVIEYVNPTSRAFDRMKTILFLPFDMGKWFALGFSAWLASFLDNGGGGNYSTSNSGGGGSSENSTGVESLDFQELFAPAIKFFEENTAMILGIGAIVFLLLVVIFLILLWLGSRGKFMFLDNVIHNRALVKEPWSQYRTLGNSLFRWRFVFVIICFILVVLLVGGSAWVLFQNFDQANIQVGWIAGLVSAIFAFFLLLLAIGYVATLLEDFVIPVMYKNNLTAQVAWRSFLQLHRENKVKFFLYFLWKTLISFMAGIAILIAVLVTCCIALIPLIIPYLGSVLTLPVSVFLRGLGPEFIRQFGPDYDLLGNLEPS